MWSVKLWLRPNGRAVTSVAKSWCSIQAKHAGFQQTPQALYIQNNGDTVKGIGERSFPLP